MCFFLPSSMSITNQDTQQEANNKDIRFTPVWGEITVPKLLGMILM
jgi:hypothetical protein